MKWIDHILCATIALISLWIGITLSDMRWEKSAVSKGFGTYVNGKFYWTREKVYVEESLYEEVIKNKHRAEK